MNAERPPDMPRLRFTGAIDLDVMNITRSTVGVRIEATSIETGNADRDTHLRSSAFLDVEEFPILAFASTRIEKKHGRLIVGGELALRGVTRAVELEVEQLGTVRDPKGRVRVLFHAVGWVNRKDFGLTWNEVLASGGLLVGEKLELDFDIQAIKEDRATVPRNQVSRSPQPRAERATASLRTAPRGARA